MAKGVNKWIGIGNAVRDPEVKYLPSGGAVGSLTIACNDSYKDKNSGQMIDATEFVRVVFYGKLAEIVGDFVKKGSKLYVEGSLHTRSWEDKQTGAKKYATEIKASQMQMLDSRGGQSGEQQSSTPATATEGGHFPSYEDFERGGQAAPASKSGGNDFDDDIPFAPLGGVLAI